MAPSSAIVHSSTLIRVGRKSVRTTGAPFAGPVRRPGRQGGRRGKRGAARACQARPERRLGAPIR